MGGGQTCCIPPPVPVLIPDRARITLARFPSFCLLPACSCSFSIGLRPHHTTTPFIPPPLLPSSPRRVPPWHPSSKLQPPLSPQPPGALLSLSLCLQAIFRGFLLPSLHRYLPICGAVAVSSVCFAMAHFSVQRFFPLVFLGAIMGTVYARSKNLLSCIALHSLWNLYIFYQLAGSQGMM